MKDFLKILAGLLLLVGAFHLGRGFGEGSITDSQSYVQLQQSQSKLLALEEKHEKLRSQFQDLLDSTDLKQAHEILGKMVVILLADLALKISKDQEDQIAFGRNICEAAIAQQKKSDLQPKNQPVAAVNIPGTTEIKKEDSQVKRAQWTSGQTAQQFKSKEWMAMNAGDENQALRRLEQAKISNMNEFLSQSIPMRADRLFGLEGEYKGLIRDLKDQAYASLTMKFRPKRDGARPSILVESIIVRDGKESARTSEGNEVGKRSEDSNAWIFEQEPGRYFQIYQLRNEAKIFGHYYEVMPEGTTKLIGPLSLTRVDQF